MQKAGVFLALVLTTSTLAMAKPMTCGELKDRLENKVVDLQFDSGSELMGVVATHRELCFPPGMILGTLRAVFIHWADGNPKLMNMPSWDCAARAFRESFPCEQAIPKSDRTN